ncbi:MAG TPA: hypothetical protein VK939_03620 [Longimicrobiales bacterium]|nr:hypothetical protein [Longimicrobiales bacterium]
MKDILDKLARALPAYLGSLLELLAGPKRFVAKKLEEEGRLTNALIFLAVSAALAFLLKLPLLKGDVWLELGAAAAFTFLIWFGFGAAIWLAWRIVGGRGGLEGTLVISFYFAGVIELLLACAYLGFIGTLRAADPAAYQTMLEALSNGRFLALAADPAGPLQSTGGRLAISIAMLLVVAAWAWILAGWGAYRNHHERSRWHAALAFGLALVMVLPLYAFFGIVANALVG